MLEIRLAPEAEADFDRLVDFLDALSPNAAVRAAEAIRSGIVQLADFPMMGRALDERRRQLVIRFGDSGYLVQYRVDPDAVFVSRILHMREDRD